jgi:endonuclease/exonuclease/phosphatase family metal-dependent hydrolase
MPSIARLVLARLLPACLVLACASCADVGATRTARPLRVMTFNVRVPVEADGINVWAHRRALAAQVIRDADADIVGTQELVRRQGDDLVAALPHTAWFGRGRHGDDSDEHMGLLYRTDRLRVLETGDFWLSDTPDTPGSITWGNLYARMVTWARFQRIADGATVTVFNTHFPYRDEDASARLRSAQLILSRLRAVPAGEPVILTGDFNTTPDTDVYRLLTSWLTDARVAAPAVAGPDQTFHDFTGHADQRIDWILARGLQPLSLTTVTLHDGAIYPSDHFPVVAEFALPPAH